MSGGVNLPEAPLGEETLRALLAGYEAGAAEDCCGTQLLFASMFCLVVGVVALYFLGLW